jgi:xanthine dehydrogenase accessory factor
MAHDILEEAGRLRAEREPFALATVVAAKPPTSGTPGARAIIRTDGRIEGWIGGQCAQPAVVRLGLEALADGAPRLVVLSPDGQEVGREMRGVVRVPMLCASQGELQVFVEPFLPRVELVVIGASPVATLLARLGALLEFDVWACDPAADMETFPDAVRLVQGLDDLAPQLPQGACVIVATMNTYDEEAARVAIQSEATYVGVVASERRFESIRESLRAEGVSEERLSRLARPKGLPGAALLPSEIAFGAMAETLRVRRERGGLPLSSPAQSKAEPHALDAPQEARVWESERGGRGEAVDPICGMTVDIATARYTSERDGVRYYFCCAGCQKAFETA